MECAKYRPLVRQFRTFHNTFWSHILKNVHLGVNYEFIFWELHGTIPILLGFAGSYVLGIRGRAINPES
jgi:hypothetical protein